jgi:hypothetical protein
MADEEPFDIYGDDDLTSPSSPSQQSGPKKRLRRERSSSAPPLVSPKDEDDDGASTPRQKKVKEDDEEDNEDPFREYDNHVFTLVGHSCLRGLFESVLIRSIIVARPLHHLNNPNRLLSNGSIFHRINKQRQHCMLANSIG